MFLIMAKFDKDADVAFPCYLNKVSGRDNSMVVSATENQRHVAVWWAEDEVYTVHLTPDTARAMGERLITIANVLER